MPGHEPGQQGVARLVVGRHRLLLVRKNLLALRAHQQFVAGVLEVGHVDVVFVVPAGPEGGLVDQIADVGAGQADGARRQPLQIDVEVQRHVLAVDLEDRQAALVAGPIDRDVAVEPAGPQQGRIEHVGPVRGGHDDDRLVLGEAVHLAEDLVERLLALVVSAADAGAAVAAHGVDLVDEEDGRGVFLGRVEQVADPPGAHADEHLDELGAVDRKEGHAGLAGHGAAQQRLARARRTHQQNALGHAGAEPLELGRIAEELDDLLQVVLDAFQAGHVGEVIGLSPPS